MALEIRIVIPSGAADSVEEIARNHPGVSEISRTRGVSLVPKGDVIVLQAVRESVEGLLEKLEALNIAQQGSISVSSPELVTSDRLDEVEKEVSGDGADAIIWAEVEKDTNADSKLTWNYMLFLIIAVQLAGIGIVTDSTIAIVGAMVVGPEFGPLAGLALAVVDRRWKLARRGAVALIIGFPIAIVLAALATMLSLRLGFFIPADVLRENRATEFIYHPGPYSFIVAVLAGAAGMLSLIGRKSAALVGVFISVTTIPAAGYIAVALVLGEQGRAVGSVLQLLVNVSGIVLAAVTVLFVYRMARRRRPGPSIYSAAHGAANAHNVGSRNPFRR